MFSFALNLTLEYIILPLLILILFLVFLLLGVFPFLKKRFRVTFLSSFIVSITVSIAVIFIFTSLVYPLHFAMPPTLQSHAPGGLPASLPINYAAQFLLNLNKFEKVEDIGTDPNDVPPPLTRKSNEVVKINMVTKEVISQVAPGIYFNYWTFNSKVPGPMYRIMEGDTVEVTITNDKSSLHPHNIDFHSATGPGGGAAISTVKPGETKKFLWKALAPGLYVYHCAQPNVSTHNSHGQYGQILVEPKEGLSKVDKEFQITQGELYTKGNLGKKGLQVFDAQAMLDGKPNYVTFNGKIEQKPRMKVKVGDRIRIYIGNGGVSLVSAFHIIGEIFDNAYPEASITTAPLKNTQTITVLPGGSAIVEFTADVPGKYLLVDHALSRMNKGAWATLEVEGSERPDIFKPL